ncbi:GyrI-like domain-containing protein [Leucobacter sp. gxy201]|uniref:GyrI-like domain-containing protein n=1 Tax=Leucobacter sp. gxy201 TaxID=2957200 RepID=UPI003D9FEFB8
MPPEHPAARKIDFVREGDAYRAKPGEFRLIDLPPMQYLMIDGHGDPNRAPEFAAAVETLYPVAYGLKFASKRELGRDYVVPPLEGLWWADDMSAFTAARDKSLWHWTLMLMLPAWLGHEDLDRSVHAARQKGRAPRLDALRLETLTEGLCLQTLHIGPFDDEGETLARLHEEIAPRHGLALRGTHHEIYLGDFRRTAPEKRRTILRQPVRRAEGIAVESRAVGSQPV